MTRPIPFSQAAQRIREQRALRTLAQSANDPGYRWLAQRRLEQEAHATSPRFTLWAFAICVSALFALIFTATLVLP